MRVLVCCAWLAVAASVAKAQTILSTSFETNQGYNLGSLIGQQGWFQDIGNAQAFTIQNSVVSSGSQAVQLNPAGQSFFTRALQFTSFNTASTANKKIVSEIDVFVTDAPDRAEFRLINYSSFNAFAELSLGRDGKLRFVSDSLDVGSYGFNQWNKLTFINDFSTNRASLYLNGVFLKGNVPFIPANSEFQAISLTTLPYTGTNSMYFDNLSISAVAPINYWQGTSSANWSQASNWTSGVPMAYQTVAFDAAVGNVVRYASTHDLTGLSVEGLRFAEQSAANDFTVTANALSVGYEGITSNVLGTARISTQGTGLSLSTSATFTSTAGTLTIDGTGGLNLGSHTLTLSGAGATLLDTAVTGSSAIVVQGPGQVTLAGNADNVSLGATVNGGTLVLAKNSTPSVHAIGGVLTVNNGGTARLAGTGGDQIWNGTGVTLNAGGTFDLNGASETINALNGAAGSILTNTNWSSTGELTVTGGGSFAGTLGSNGFGISLTVAGQTMTLSGTTDNAFLGATVNAGTLVLAKSSSPSVHAVGNGLTINNGGIAQLAGTGGDQIFDGAGVTLNAGGTFDMNGRSETFTSITTASGSTLTNNAASNTTSTLTVGSGTVAGTISNGGSGGVVALRKTGAATLVLSGKNTFTGNVDVTGGTLALANNALASGGPTLASPSVTVGTGATLRFDASDNFGGHNTASGPDIVVNGGTVTNSGGYINALQNLTLNGGVVNAVGEFGAFGAFSIRHTLTSTGTSTIDLGSSRLTLGQDGDTVAHVPSGTLTIASTIANNVDGPGFLKKSGVGTLILSGNNTFSGGISTEDFGTLAVTSSAALGAANNNVSFTNGVLRTNASMSLSQSMTITSGNVGFVNTNGSDVTISGVVSGNGGFIKQGTGTLTLTNNANSHANMRIDGGTVAFSSDGHLGASNGTIFLNGGALRATGSGILFLNANRNIVLQADGTIESPSPRSLFINGRVDGAFGLTTSGYNVRFLGLIGSATPLHSITGLASFTEFDTSVVNVGAGGVSLGGISTGMYKSVQLTSVGPISFSSVVSTAAGSTPVIRSTGGAITVSGVLDPGLNSFLTLGADTININGNVNNSYSGARYGLQASTSDRSIGLGDGASGTLQLSQATLSKFGPATRLIIGAPDQSGTIAVGTLGASLPTSATLRAPAGNVVINAVLVVNGNLAIDAIDVNSAANATLYTTGGLTVSNTGTNSTLAGLVAGDAGLTKNGTGSLRLSYQNTYTGTTTIANGTLIVSNTIGSATGAGNVQVESGATLSGNGAALGSVSVAGTLSPGESAGLLTTGALTLQDGATTFMELDGPARGIAGGHDAIDVNGAIAYDGTLSIATSAGAVAGDYDLFNFVNTPTTSFDEILVSGVYGSGSLAPTSSGFYGAIGSMYFTFTSSTGVLSLSAEAIPEPLTAAGVLLLSARLLGRRERIAM